MNKRGFSMDDVFHWMFYIPMTLMIVFVFVIMPTLLTLSSINPSPFDSKIMEARIFQKASTFSPIYGETNQLADDIQVLNSPKRSAYKLTINVKEYYGNKEEFDIGNPLVPVRYTKFTSKKELMEEEPIVAQLDQVYFNDYAK